MSLVSLNELKEGNIVLPYGGRELIYVTEIGRSADGDIKNYVGYPVTDSTAFISGANVLDLTQDDMSSGSRLRDLGIDKPVVLVGNNLRRTIDVDENHYTTDFKANTNPLVMQEVVSIMRQTGANEERIESTRGPRGMRFDTLTDGVVKGEGRFADRPDRDKGTRTPTQQPARTESIVLDMYLEDAVEQGFIDRKTYTILQFARDEIVTLQDAWNAVQDGTLDNKIGLTRTFDQAFPAYDDARKPQQRTLDKREQEIGKNPILLFTGKIGLIVPLLPELGFVYERTEDIISFSIESSDPNEFLGYDEAMRAMIARGFTNLEDPDTGKALSAKEVKAVKKDIEESFNDILANLTKDFDSDSLLTARKSFMAFATQPENQGDIIKHHDFSKPVVKTLRDKVESTRAEIIANRPPSLKA